MEKESYDFIIIGAGVTGMAAAMYGARLGLKTVCFGTSSSAEMPIGGVITTTNVVENYPGFIRLTGTELADKIRDHALSYDLVSIRDEKVVAIEKKKIGFMVKTGSGVRSEEHTSELQSHVNLVCRLLLEKKKKK